MSKASVDKKPADKTPAEAAPQTVIVNKLFPVIVLPLAVMTYVFSQIITELFAPPLVTLTGGSLVMAQFLTIILFYGSVVTLTWGSLKILGINFKTIGLKKPRWIDISYALAGFAAYFVLYVVMSLIAKAVFPGIDFEQKQQIGFESARQLSQLLPVFISLVIVPPFAEEIFFRGFLYTGLRKGWPMWLATIVTSALFALVHLQFGNGAPLLWVAAIDTFTLSIVLVILREKTNSLSSPIMLHMLKNGLAFTLLFVIGVR